VSLLATIACAVIRLYRVFSVWGAPRCRFYPTCSAYALEAIEKFGFWRGSFQFLHRLLKCHPWHAGGVDPVR
jgi:putative membrane protein insertion efficiency factor